MASHPTMAEAERPPRCPDGQHAMEEARDGTVACVYCYRTAAELAATPEGEA